MAIVHETSEPLACELERIERRVSRQEETLTALKQEDVCLQNGGTGTSRSLMQAFAMTRAQAKRMEDSASQEEKITERQEEQVSGRQEENGGAEITFEGEIDRVSKEVYRACRVVKECICLQETERCKQRGHVKDRQSKMSCEICVGTGGQLRAHRRVQRDMAEEARKGTLAVDLTSLGKGANGCVMVAAGLNMDAKRFPMVEPMSSKNETSIREALQAVVLQAEQYWGSNCIRRIHADAEATKKTKKTKQLSGARLAVNITNAAGHNTSSNGWAEHAVREACQRARACWDHLATGEKAEVRKCAMVHVAIRISIEGGCKVGGGIVDGDLLPFGSRIDFGEPWEVESGEAWEVGRRASSGGVLAPEFRGDYGKRRGEVGAKPIANKHRSFGFDSISHGQRSHFVPTLQDP